MSRPLAGGREASGKRPGHRVVVIGAGWAGAAAALSAREAHAEVVVVDGGVGASGLGAGAIDDVPWDDRERAARTLGLPLGASLIARPDPVGGGVATDLAWMANALGDGRYTVAEVGAALPVLAMTSGVFRTASAHDAALLDFTRLPGGSRVLVPRVDRASWDADSMVRLFAAQPHVISRSLKVSACEADVLRYDDERRIPDADLAARHDETSRRGWLVAQLREAIAKAGADVTAVLLGPWLGLDAPRAAELGRALGLTVGEAGVATAATAGLRFERAFALAAKRAGVRVARDRVSRVARRDGRFVVHLATDELEADGVVLAVGGLAGGGIVFDPPERGAGPEGAEAMRAPFRLSVDCGLRVEARGDIGVSGSAFGPSFDEAAWPAGGVPGALEVVGVRVDDEGRASELLHAAGDVIAARARTVGEAVLSGRRAGRHAAAL